MASPTRCVRMDLERLIVLAGRWRPFPVRRITYARVLAGLPITEAEAVDILRRIRRRDADPAEVRTLLHRLLRALPRSGLHLGRSAWCDPPEQVWHDAVRAERRVRMARMTRAETSDAVLRITAGGEHEFWLRNRLGWTFTQGGPLRWRFHDLDGDPDEIANGLFRLDALYLDRLAAPEMAPDELVGLVAHHRADLDKDWLLWRDENLLGVLDQQLPNAGVSDMLLATHRTAAAEAVVRDALARTQPDPDVLVRRD